jgi:hypothetical protein
MGGALGGILLLGGGIWAVQNALFNVDGGHRAIKYRRTTGVSKEIYSEGMIWSRHFPVANQSTVILMLGHRQAHIS